MTALADSLVTDLSVALIERSAELSGFKVIEIMAFRSATKRSGSRETVALFSERAPAALELETGGSGFCIIGSCQTSR